MHASIAERMAFGTPLDPVADDTPIHIVPRSGTALVGRIMISVIFLVSGLAKLTDPAGTIGYMNSARIPYADTLLYVAAFAEILGGLSILFGFLTRIGALGLFTYLIPTTLYFHAFWTMEGAEAKIQMANFAKNLAVMGGLAAFVAFGAGRYSIDGRLRRPMQP